MEKPTFWKTSINDIEETCNLVKKGKVSVLGKSAGGHEIKLITYGEKQDLKRTANFNSACGAHNVKYYADKTGKKPTILLIGGIHASEMEGIVAVLNLVKMIETGTDFTESKSKYDDFLSI